MDLLSNKGGVLSDVFHYITLRNTYIIHTLNLLFLSKV
jgi:hypothetical protein